MKKYVGQSLKRKEDYRLVTGTGQFVADIKLAGMLEAAFVRSPQSHAKIRQIDISKAQELPGVHVILIGDDIKGKINPITQFESHSAVPPNVAKEINPKIQFNYESVLAINKVMYVGQPVAVVVADNRYIAEDAADLIKVVYEPLSPIVDPFEAIKDGSPLVQEQVEQNIQMEFHLNLGDTRFAEQQADHILMTRVQTPRLSSNPIETRGVIADYDHRTEQTHVWSATQLPFEVRATIAHCLGWTEQNIRVTAPDVGGGFGPKGGVHPEEIVVPYISKLVGRPVKWVEDRLEHLTSARQSRDQIHDVVVAYRNDGTILSLRDEFIVDSGAVNFFGFTCAYNTAYHLRGAYKIPNFEVTSRIVLTNKTPNVPFRGAGRPEAVFTMDRVIDMIARKLKLDPVEVMKKNMIQAHEMPYDQGILVKDGARLIYDSGDYPAALNQALDMVDYQTFRQRQKELKIEGKNIGIGISTYVEGTGAGPFEGALLSVDSTGKVIAHLGASPQGQGHETVFAQIGADALGLTPDDIVIKVGDTAVLPFGAGTYASRSAVNAGSAMHEASLKLRKKIVAIAGVILGITSDEIEIEEGKIFAKEDRVHFITFQDIFKRARPAARPPLPPEIELGLQVTHYFVPPTVTFASSVHIAEVEVDKETGFVKLQNYSVVHDCGTVINPMIVDGQVQGGVAQGIGSALYEEVIYDEKGQLLTGSYMDYLLPTSMEIPTVKKGHQEHLSTRNPLGIKGVGEGGAISPPAAIANAIVDALSDLDIIINQLPVSPSRLRGLIKEAEKEQNSILTN
ncbi:xanthine dehydrogenase family protein molybdopterin-binding subunit [Bacillus sp. OK048]|uniref:xanthine dehydrogenase family protein molybdopterin-binding subunit n=1 Tax=Bacillus sp. OK048 TaxID=1882761 RepID=UPI000884537E|nr:xanthine dehydrogenase family protein molybdopterin-binding subunit [Bacillus sp. OK048]SDL87820.1 carbon-monoxide dehydrogenase large subunit [Bacillus sp. OK048]